MSCLSFDLHGLQPAGLLRPWGFPGKNTGAGCHFLLQGIFPTQGLILYLLIGRWILYHCVTWEALSFSHSCLDTHLTLYPCLPPTRNDRDLSSESCKPPHHRHGPSQGSEWYLLTNSLHSVGDQEVSSELNQIHNISVSYCQMRLFFFFF